MGAMTEASKLLTTGAAAHVVGVDPSTLSRWAQSGTVVPPGRTAGGHLRWDLDQLRNQLAQLGTTPAEKAPGTAST